MNPSDSFKEKSYQKHADHFRDYAEGGKLSEHAKTWMCQDTVDSWRHQRMHQLLDPVLEMDPSSQWLTVGDGRYGRDAKYISEKKGKVIASDISEYLLKEAKDNGYIEEYKVENAEDLTFEDESFDYVFCKESYHHFPRPFIALYEMLRTARKGVILIEPNDEFLSEKWTGTFFRNFKNFIKKLSGKTVQKHMFEDSGNYLYSLSKREIEKLALGLGFRMIASQGINDAYYKGGENEKLSERGKIQTKTKRLLTIKNLFTRFGLMDHGILAVIIFKKTPSVAMINSLQIRGYSMTDLPLNPYA